MARITIKDVAKSCGVSVSTVSRAINDHDEISVETRERILKVIDEMGYVPNSNARNLKIVTSNVVAVVIKGIGNPFFQPMIEFFEQEINKNGYSFLLYKVEEQEDEIDIALKLVNDNKLKAIIFLGAFLFHDKSRLAKIGIPFVITTIVNKEVIAKDSAYVGINDVEESKKIVEYLISLGHTKIGVIGPRKNDKSIGMLRIKGYKKALKENGIKIDEDLIITTSENENPYTYQYGYEKVEKLIKEGDKCTAIFCLSDAIAIGAIKKMTQLGLKVPEDYSVVGFDGIEINSYLPKTITTIRQPVEDIAKGTCKQLFKIMDGKKFSKISTFDGELWVGETTRKIKNT